MADNRVVLTLEVKDSGAIRVLKDASKGLDKLGKDAKDADSKLDGVERGLNGTAKAGKRAKSELGPLSGVFKGMSMRVLTANQSVQFLRTTLGPLVRVVKEFVAEGAEFEQLLLNVTTLLDGDASAAVEKYRDGIHAVLLEVPSDANELGAAAYQIVSAGINDTAGSLQVLKTSAQLALGGLSTTAEAADLLTSALNAFQIDANGTVDGMSAVERTANTLMLTVRAGKTTVAELSQQFGAVAPIAKKLGVSFEELQAATAAITVTGVATSQAQTALAQAMLSLLKPAETMEMLFQRISQAEGANIRTGTELIAHFGGLAGAFDAINTAAAGNEQVITKALKRAQGIQIFFSLTGAQKAKFAEAMADMGNNLTAFQDAVAKASEGTQKKIQLMQGAFFILRDTIFEELTPTIGEMTEGFRDFLVEAKETGKIERWAETIKGAVIAVRDAIGWLIEHATFLKRVFIGVMTVNVFSWFTAASTSAGLLSGSIVKLTANVKKFGAAWAALRAASPFLAAGTGLSALAGAGAVAAGAGVVGAGVAAGVEGVRRQRRGAFNETQSELGFEASQRAVRPDITTREQAFLARGNRRALGEELVGRGIEPPEPGVIVAMGGAADAARGLADAVGEFKKSRDELLEESAARSSILIQTAQAELALRREELKVLEKSGASTEEVATAKDRVVDAGRRVLQTNINELEAQRAIIDASVIKSDLDIERLALLDAQLKVLRFQVENADTLASKLKKVKPGGEDPPQIDVTPFERWAEAALDTRTKISEAFAQTLDGIASGITQMVMGGKADFASLAQSIIAMLIQIQIQAALAGIFGPILSGGGGSTGADAPPPVAMTFDAPPPGVMTFDAPPPVAMAFDAPPPSAPTITPAPLAARGAAAPINVNITTPEGTQSSVQENQRGDGGVDLNILVEQVEGAMASNIGMGGGLSRTLEGQYGLNRVRGASR